MGLALSVWLFALALLNGASGIRLTNTFSYDALGRLVAVTNQLGNVTRYEYNEQGQQVTQTDAESRTTRFEYDPLGRRVKRALPLNQFETYGYDVAGRMTNRTDFNGRTTTFIHDVMNRLVEKRPDAAFAAAPVQFGYNELGLRTNMVDASGVTTFEYDNRNRLVRKATPEGTLTYAYNANGQVTNITSLNANGVVLNYAYDALNRLGDVLDPHAGHTTYTYDDVGNLRGFTYPNGVNHFYEYSALNRLTNLNVSAGLTPLANYAYTLAPSGHRTSATESRVVNPLNPQVTTLTRLYGYDRTYRLTNETIGGTSYASPSTLGYSYDRVGNRLQLASTQPGIVSQLSAYDPNDRLLSDTSDSNGNTLTAPGFAQAQPDQYDYENRLVRRTEGNKTVTIVYDGDGQRVKKTVTTATNTLTTRFLVDLVNPTGYAQVLEEITTDTANPQLLTPQVTRIYAYGHDLISQDQVSGNAWLVSYYGYDGHGSTRLLTDHLGFITNTYDYDAFGNLIARTGSTPNNDLFTGEQYDPDLGLYFLRARYQNTQTGRFWTMDEFEGESEDPATLHKYLYVHANPVSFVDPSGQMTLAEVQTTGGVVALLAYALYSTTPPGRQLNNAIGVALVSLMSAITIELSDLVVYNRNRDTEDRVEGLLAHALTHAVKLEGYGSGGGGPQDPRNGWKNEVKAALDRAKRLVEKRLKNVPAKMNEYLAKIKEIAEKSGVTLD